MGNVMIHLPNGGGGGGKGGKFIGGTKLSPYATVKDSAAQNNIISVTSAGTHATALFGLPIAGLELGCYAVMLRMKVSNISNTNNLVRIKLTANDANGTVLGEHFIKANAFKQAGVYQTVGVITELRGTKGTKLYVSAAVEQNTAAITVGIDYLLIAPAFTAITALG